MRSRIDWKRWRRRLIAGLVVLTLGALAAVAVLVYAAYQRTSAELVIERDRQVTYLSAARLKDEFAKFSDELVALARTPEVSGGIVEGRGSELARVGRRLSVFDGGAVLLDNFGKVRAAHPERPEILGADWSDRDFFRELLVSPGVYFSDAAGDGPDGSQVVVMSVPVRGDSGEFVGVLAGLFRLGEPRNSAFYAGIIRLRLGQGGSTYVIDGSGKILYDSDYSRIGERFDVAALPGFAAGRGAGRMRDAEGHDIVAAYAPVPGTRWLLVSEVEWAAITGPIQRYARTLLILLAVGMVLPVLGMALLLREQNSALLERERADQEERAASLIQQRILPQQVPMLPGWSLAVSYQPSRMGRGDFHDFTILPDGRLVFVLGAVGETGLLAAHLMATTRAVFRGAARQELPPAEVLECSNGLLASELQPDTHIACMYGLLDPATGRLQMANAGFNEPHFGGNGTGKQLRAPGEPLGVRPEARYEQVEVTLEPGQYAVFFSDGLISARNDRGEAFGDARLAELLARPAVDAPAVIEALLAGHRIFTGRSGARDRDLTLLVVQRMPTAGPAAQEAGHG